VKKRKIKTQTKIFLHHLSSTFFEFSSSLLLEYGCKRLLAISDWNKHSTCQQNDATCHLHNFRFLLNFNFWGYTAFWNEEKGIAKLASLSNSLLWFISSLMFCYFWLSNALLNLQLRFQIRAVKINYAPQSTLHSLCSQYLSFVIEALTNIIAKVAHLDVKTNEM